MDDAAIRRVAIRRVANPFSQPRTRRQWVTDSILFGAALAYWLVTALDDNNEVLLDPSFFRFVDVPLGLLACVALWWSRRYPVAIGLFMLLPGSLTLTGTIAILVGVFRMAAYARPRASVPITLVHIVCAIPYHWLVPMPGITTAIYVIVIPLLYVLMLSFGLLSRSRRLVIEGLEQVVERDRERYEQQLSDLRRNERERIAREMHDVLAHRISLLSVHAGALEYRTGEAASGEQPPTSSEVHDAAVVIRNNAHLAIDDLRQVLSVLRDEGDESDVAAPQSRPQPRLGDVLGLVEEARLSGQGVTLDFGIAPEQQVRDSVQRSIYRVVQEGLTNARKHAPFSPVAVRVEAVGDQLVVTVVNPVPPGLAKSEIPGAGAGLSGLAERLRIDGGTLSHGVDGGEFLLVGRVPALEWHDHD